MALSPPRPNAAKRASNSPSLETTPKILDRHVGVSKNASQRSLGDIAASMDRYCRGTSIRVAQDEMTSGDPHNREPSLLKRPDDPFAGHRRHRWH